MCGRITQRITRVESSVVSLKNTPVTVPMSFDTFLETEPGQSNPDRHQEISQDGEARVGPGPEPSELILTIILIARTRPFTVIRTFMIIFT